MILSDKSLLYLITFIIDYFLVYILYEKNNNYNDNLFIKLTIMCHILFYYALTIENSFLLNLLHILVFFLPFCSLFLKNKNIKKIVISLLLIIVKLWKIKGKYILHNLPGNLSKFGFGKNIEIFTILLIIILLYQIY